MSVRTQVTLGIIFLKVYLDSSASPVDHRDLHLLVIWVHNLNKWECLWGDKIPQEVLVLPGLALSV